MSQSSELWGLRAGGRGWRELRLAGAGRGLVGVWWLFAEFPQPQRPLAGSRWPGRAGAWGLRHGGGWPGWREMETMQEVVVVSH